MGLGVGDGVGLGVGDGDGAATHALRPVSPAVHMAVAHGVQLMLPALPAKDPAAHAAQAVTLL